MHSLCQDTLPKIKADDFDFGFRGGFSSTKLRGDFVEGIYSDGGFGSGIFIWVQYRFNEKIGIQGEIGFTHGSSNIKFDNELSIYSNIRFRLGYTEVPVMFTFMPHKRLKLLGGISFNYKTTEEITYSAFGIYTGQTPTETTRRLDINTSIGFEYRLPYWNGRSGIGCRLNHGLFNINKDAGFIGEGKLKNRSLGIYWSYFIK